MMTRVKNGILKSSAVALWISSVGISFHFFFLRPCQGETFPMLCFGSLVAFLGAIIWPD